jgi:hypothetical protein
MTETYIMGGLLFWLLVVAWRISAGASRNPDNKFDLSESFTDDNGKTSMARISVFVALVVSTWVLVALVVTNRLTEWFYTAYIGAFVINGIGSKFADKGKE